MLLSGVISEAGRLAAAVPHVCESRIVLDHGRQVLVILHLDKLVVGAAPEILALADGGGNLVAVAKLRAIHPLVREAGHLVEEQLNRVEAAAAVPARVGVAARLEPAQDGEAAFARAQVVGLERLLLALVKRGLRVLPLAARLAELERVVVKLRVEGEPPRESARAQGPERVGPGNLVDVGDDEHVAQGRGAVAGELGEDLLEAGVALQRLIVPRAARVEAARELELVVQHLVVVLCEAVPALLGQHGLGVAVERLGRLDDDEEVHLVVQRVQPDLEPVELRVDHGEVVDFAPRRLRDHGVWREAVRRAQLVVCILGRVVERRDGERVLVAEEEPHEDDPGRYEDAHEEQRPVRLLGGQPAQRCRHEVGCVLGLYESRGGRGRRRLARWERWFVRDPCCGVRSKSMLLFQRRHGSASPTTATAHGNCV